MILKNALKDIPIRSIILGRIENYSSPSEIKKNVPFPKTKNDELLIIKKCDGIGISGANENSNSVLNHYSKTTKIRAIHSAETKQSTLKSKKSLENQKPFEPYYETPFSSSHDICLKK